MKLLELVRPALKLLGPRARRTWMDGGRAHIEYRGVGEAKRVEFTRRVKQAAARLDRVLWVEVNPYLRRVVIATEPGAYTLERLTSVVEEAERLSQIEGAPFVEDDRDHPADADPGVLLILELFTDALGFAIGSALSLSPFKPSSIGSSAAAITSIVRSTPGLRRELDDRLCAQRAELAMNLVVAIGQGVAQRPVSSLVDIVHKSAMLRELAARRRLWRDREPELCAAPQEHEPAPFEGELRPCELPPGPIEDYTDRAWLVSLAGFGVSFVTTRNVQRAIAALWGGLPKPAKLGREMFAAELGRQLARRGVLVLDRRALLRLDRVDCLVLQGDLISTRRFEISEIVSAGRLESERARALVQALFDPERPIDVKSEGEFTLGPARAVPGRLSPELTARVDELARRGGLVLALARDRRVEAIIEVQVVAQTGVEELIAAAHDAQMHVVVATNDDSVLQELNADDVVSEQEGLRSAIRRLQQQGRVVCFVGAGRSPGFQAADVGVGLVRDETSRAWNAHLLCGDDLSDVRFLILSCVVARQGARQRVNGARGPATLGALSTAGGILPMTTRRVITIVNTATLVSMANAARCSAALHRRALPAPRDRTPWYALDAHGVLHRLNTRTVGLSRREVRERTGPAVARKLGVVELFESVADELFNPLAPLLAAGAGLSAVVGSAADAGMVGGVLVLNALVGGVQRFRTERAIRELERTTSRRALCRRDGELREVDARELVVGDIVLLAPGDVVPADCRVIEAESLEVDASSLTGESLPVRKSARPSFDPQIADRSSMLYEGTAIAAGRATAVVVAVGDQTEARRGAIGARRDAMQSGVELRLRSLIDMTAPIALVAGAGLVGAGLVRGRRLADLVGSGVSLAIASVPEGLPLLATAAQLAAARRLSERGALVRNARSIEALGRVDTLCVDKTGTVTQGRIELSRLSDGDVEQEPASLGEACRRVLGAALRATPVAKHTRDKLDPTDAALLRAAALLELDATYGASGWEPGSELAFEAGRGYHAVLGRSASGRVLSVKGAPEVLLPQCTRWRRGDERVPLDSDAERHLSDQATELARRGLRVLAVAERVVTTEDDIDLSLIGLSFCGFLAFSDPVRPSAGAALDRLRRAGVQTVMITGDHPRTAEAIAAELGLGPGRRVLSGAELSLLSDDELDLQIDDVAVFARVTPSQKVRVVRALQRAGRVVAMVGDGSNDAPAIRLANVGIAIGEQSTAAARGAADVVLTDERIETLADAVVEGRAMWASVRDAVSILIGGNLGEIGFTLAAGLVDGRSPLNARQLLLVNLLTDVAPAMAIALRPPTHATLESLANEGPEASLGEPLNRDIASRAAVTAVGAGAAWLVARATGSRERAATVGLLALVGTQLGQTLTSGGFTRPVLVTGAASSLALAAIVQTPGVSHFFGCRPLGPVGWITATAASAAATAGALAFPHLAQKLAQQTRLVDIVMASDPDVLPPGVESRRLGPPSGK